MTGPAAMALGSLAALIAAGLLHLALAPSSARQLPVKGLLAGSAALTATATCLCARWLGAAESVYFVLMVLTIALSALPFLTALTGRNR